MHEPYRTVDWSVSGTDDTGTCRQCPHCRLRRGSNDRRFKKLVILFIGDRSSLNSTSSKAKAACSFAPCIQCSPSLPPFLLLSPPSCRRRTLRTTLKLARPIARRAKRKRHVCLLTQPSTARVRCRRASRCTVASATG